MKEILIYSSLITIAISGVSIVAGIIFIILSKREWHHRAMVNACIFAVIFVILYLIRTALIPTEPYKGPFRSIFLFILWSHTFLAIVNFPLAVVTVRYAFKNNLEKHKKIAPITAMVWIYVAVTGWLIYAFHLFT